LGFFSSQLPDINAVKAKQYIKGLIRLLDHPTIDIRWQSSDALGSLGTIATLPLLEVLTHRNPSMKIGAIKALGTIHD
jgi:HEAT repeat protein